MADPAWLPQVKAVFDAAGIPPEVWVPIMLHESGANPNASNNTLGQTTKAGTVPEWSVGLFQINVHAYDLPPDQEAALAAKLTDPVENAKQAVQKMGPAWQAVQGAGLNLSSPVVDLPWLVGVRSGWPGGSVTCPCNSCGGAQAYCQSLKGGFASVAQAWANAVNAVSNTGNDLIAPYFAGGQAPSGGTSPSIGQEVGNLPTISGATLPATGGPDTTGKAAPSSGDLGPTILGVNVKQLFAAAFQSTENQAHADFTAWLKTPAADDTIFFAFGAIILLIGIAAILWEPGKKVVKVVGSGAVKAGEGAAVVAAA